MEHLNLAIPTSSPIMIDNLAEPVFTVIRSINELGYLAAGKDKVNDHLKGP